MKTSLIALAALISSMAVPTEAQTAEDSVVAVITGFFDAMRASDSAAARRSFSEGALLMRALPDDLQRNGIDGIIRAIGSPKNEIWDEVIWDTDVYIDGSLASVWTKYAFYLGSNLSHCGVDSFQMYRQPDGWKIYMITDTQRRQGCETPPNR